MRGQSEMCMEALLASSSSGRPNQKVECCGGSSGLCQCTITSPTAATISSASTLTAATKTKQNCPTERHHNHHNNQATLACDIGSDIETNTNTTKSTNGDSDTERRCRLLITTIGKFASSYRGKQTTTMSTTTTTTTTTIAEPVKQQPQIRPRQQPVSFPVFFSYYPFLLVATTLTLATMSPLSGGQQFVSASETNNNGNNNASIQQFNDPDCKWTNEEPPTDSERFLMIMRCDLQPVVRVYFDMIPVLEPNGPRRVETLTDIQSMVGVQRDFDLDSTRFEILNFSYNIEKFYNEVLIAQQKKEFCTYPTIKLFKQLRNYAFYGSKLLNYFYDLMTIEYHTICLRDSIEKLPKVPQIVKEVVDIYIDGKNSELLPDLNRPPGFNDEKKDEFNFDVVRAIKNEGKLIDVVNLVMDFGWSGNNMDKVLEFKKSCKKLVIEIEERWQSMEMMSEMLSNDINNIQSLNNFIMRALIPTKYADVCSQLSMFA